MSAWRGIGVGCSNTVEPYEQTKSKKVQYKAGVKQRFLVLWGKKVYESWRGVKEMQ